MSEMSAIAEQPGAGETEFTREQVGLLTHEMVVSAAADTVIVRLLGSPKRYTGCTPAQALRIGAAFIRAGLRVDPSLRAQVVEEAVGGQAAADASRSAPE
ncbi:hypothetical protein FNL55_12575 [Tardiphaga sp. vice352]|uniref:hypothetical protein n=1 Tax=Tardiphaga sp. vice352 TaxID=2592816 RepID=UPI001163D104|nr:hypothetical protein [Tardiphaga sp. vice352]QDM32073.1 hypothetical protein FNL55_12575 [Tardiphaga sp. vice352]